MRDSRRERWLRWFRGPIREEILAAHLHRFVYNEVGRIVRENKNLPGSYFWQYFSDTYATTQAVAIRRQAERRKSVRSLGRLITEISEEPDRISRSYFLGLWDDDDQSYATRLFDERFADPNAPHLDPARAQADLEAIKIATSPIKTYVDKHLAHNDPAPRKTVPTFSELDRAIDELGSQFQKYGLLLTAGDYVLVPVLQADWQAIFRQAWMRDAGKEFRERWKPEIERLRGKGKETE